MLFRKGQKVKILPNRNWSTAYHNRTYSIVERLNDNKYTIEDKEGYQLIGWFEPEGQGTIWIKVGSTGKSYLPSWL